MNYREFGRTGWRVSDVGYGMWGMGSWSNSNDAESAESLQASLDRGCNFFDTAYAYGEGHSEELLGQLVRTNADTRVFTATKVPPRNQKWPAVDEYTVDDCYPPDHIEKFVHKSLANANLKSFDLVQFHTWNDAWVEDDRWVRTVETLRRDGLINAIGISINRWEPWNGVRAVRAGLVDSVQVIYNIFDQNPEDDLFPACHEMNVAVIARVPFDEGSLTGQLTRDSKWPEGDWRNIYFVPENLLPTLERVDAVKSTLEEWNQSHRDSEAITLPELALRFILSNPDVSTIIPGMRKLSHVEANILASDKGPLPSELVTELRKHRWVRKPAPWSD